MDKPLTEKDFEPQYAGLIGIDFIKEKVQSAKRLLKEKIDNMILEDCQISYVKYLIDACFQIPDGDGDK